MGTSFLELCRIVCLFLQFFLYIFGSLNVFHTECNFSILSFQSYSLLLFLLAPLAILSSYIIGSRYFRSTVLPICDCNTPLKIVLQ